MLKILFKTSRAISFFLIGFLGVCVLAGCYQVAGFKENQPLTATNCYWINHAVGQTCVPNRIERLVTLNTASFENAIALGLKPLATVEIQALTELFKEELVDVVDIGKQDSPNLERVLQLEPDLILGREEEHRRLYSQLSQIAPTVLVNVNHSGEWKKVFAFMADVLSKSDQAEKVMNAYNTRLEDFKRTMEINTSSSTQSNSGKPTISIVRIYPNMVTLYTKVGFIGTILQDVGLPRPPSQDLDREETESLGFSTIQYTLSRETFDKADGDIIFVSVGNWDDKIDDVFVNLKADPLWSQLRAVQQDAVYEVGDYWIGSGLIAANAVIDDLYKYLVNTSSSDI